MNLAARAKDDGRSPRRFRGFSLRSKISAALLIITVLSIASTGYFTIRESYSALDRQAEEEALTLASALAEPVNELLKRMRDSITRLSRAPAIVSMDPDRQRRAFDLLIDATALFDGIVVSDAKGRVLLTDKTGPLTSGLLPVRPEDLAAAPVASGETTFSKIFRSSTGTICVAIGAPIRRGGVTIGVLSGIIALERHTMGGMKGIRFGRSGYAYLIDASGLTISHPNPERIMESVSEYRPPPELTSTLAIYDWVNTEGEKRLAALAPVADFGWYVVVTRLREEAEAPARRLLKLLTAILAVGLAVSIVVAAVLARGIAEPLSTLMKGVRDLSAGRTAARFEPGAGDEIRQLTEAFNDMASALGRTIRHLETFGYSVAHDLRAPARTITAFSELILQKESGLDEESRGHFRRILAAGKRMRSMLDGLMTLSRLSQETLSVGAADLSAIARDCARELSALEPERRIVLSIEDGMTANGDPRLLRVLMWSLLDNAWKFTRGRVDPRVGVGKQDRGDRVPAFFVRDNGPGFDPALEERLFKPFHRLSNAEGVPGVGIGLASAARVVELHGGALWAESGPEAGAAFFFTLGGSR